MVYCSETFRFSFSTAFQTLHWFWLKFQILKWALRALYSLLIDILCLHPMLHKPLLTPVFFHSHTCGCATPFAGHIPSSQKQSHSPLSISLLKYNFKFYVSVSFPLPNHRRLKCKDHTCISKHFALCLAHEEEYSRTSVIMAFMRE